MTLRVGETVLESAFLPETRQDENLDPGRAGCRGPTLNDVQP